MARRLRRGAEKNAADLGAVRRPAVQCIDQWHCQGSDGGGKHRRAGGAVSLPSLPLSRAHTDSYGLPCCTGVLCCRDPVLHVLADEQPVPKTRARVGCAAAHCGGAAPTGFTGGPPACFPASDSAAAESAAAAAAAVLALLHSARARGSVVWPGKFNYSSKWALLYHVGCTRRRAYPPPNAPTPPARATADSC